jgi:serine/threonine protein kinase
LRHFEKHRAMKKPSIFGKYLLLERLNVGGMAEVFIAKAFGVEGFERLLAIKRILPTMAEDNEFVSMFIDEARISVQLAHANIVHIHELGKYQDAYFIAMEYVAGKDLRSIIEWQRKQGKPMPATQAVFIASKICEGLDYAHRKKDARGNELGIIHRDVSPQNMLVSYEGQVKIIDFGIAKAAIRSQKTQAGILKGKFGYMSPEQVRGLPIDRRSDVFSAGVLLFELLTGEKLFVGESDFSTLEKVRNAVVPQPSSINPSIPPELEKVLLKALAREPDDRYQWASDLHDDLVRFLVASPVGMYTSKQLATFIQDAFAEDLAREDEKMKRYATISKPEGFDTAPRIQTPIKLRRTKTSNNIVIVEPPPKPGAAAEASVQPVLPEIPLPLTAALPETTQLVEVQPKLSADADSDEEEGDDRTQVMPEAELRQMGLSLPPRSSPPPLPFDETPIAKAPIVIGQDPRYWGETIIGPHPEGGVRKTLPVGLAAVQAASEPAKAAKPLNGAAARPPVKIHPKLQRVWQLPLTLREKKVVLSIVGGASLALLCFLAALPFMGRRTTGIVVSALPADRVSLQLNGRPIKNQTFTALAPGDYELVATAPAHRTFKKKLSIQEGSTPSALSVSLEPEAEAPKTVETAPAAALTAAVAPGTRQQQDKVLTNVKSPEAPSAAEKAEKKTFAARFTSPDEGVTIYVDGKVLGRTPIVTSSRLAADKSYRFEAKRAGYRSVSGQLKYDGKDQQEVAIHLERLPQQKREERAGRDERGARDAATSPVIERASSSVTPRLKPKGRLACSSNPPFADVYVDGKPTGRQTPIPLNNPLELPAGSHKVVFRLGAKSSAPQQVEIRENQIYTLRNVAVE